MINQTPKVSIIVPIYNAVEYLSRSIQCLINQTLDDIEIRSVDDGYKTNHTKYVKDINQKIRELSYFIKLMKDRVLLGIMV